MGLYFPDTEPAATSRRAIQSHHSAARLLRLDAEFTQACQQRDGDWLARHLADDFRCVLRDGVQLDRDRFIAGAFESPSSTIEDAAVQFEGDVAIVRSIAAAGSVREHVTDLWVGRNDRWQLLAAQRTAIKD